MNRLFHIKMFSFIQNRPPLVIFSACIIVTAVTLFSFAFYIKDVDSIPDSDKNHEWTSLLGYFNKLEGCVSNENKTVNSKYQDAIVIQTLVKVNVSDIAHFDYIEGHLILDGWEAKCPKDTPKPDNLEISFHVPKSDKKTSELDICVNIKGPSEYFPTFSEPNCVVALKELREERRGFLVTRKRSRTPFCQSGNPLKIEFHPQTKDNLKNYLNNNQKTLIYVHLLWSSFFLLSIILLIVIYAIFYSHKNLRKFSHLSLER